MARVCSQCKHYDAGGEETVCPTCNMLMQFTLLPPAAPTALSLNEAPSPPPAAVARRPVRSSDGTLLLGFLRGWRMYRIFGGLILVPLALFVGPMLGWGKGSVKERYDRIQTGMSPTEVEKILDPNPDPRSFRARDRARGVTLSTHGKADFWWEESGVKMHFEFMNGRLVKKTQTGLN
jgi:hypothetical protein